ncbi:hypothetical protein FNW02_27050 [Komarekiella sp. 'clone 1']|uniref:Uncharacterized protein n=1 Tax=Komarekiella delphini-convector SJRDD-AB1 TaxID=2593771 RepID=A0AA40T2G7_9NOST|nr:hypothetical protein [Komarekiella delphini-convector]MBD6619387.1 hypothetical protein [Komarekiella delphini-convector SJRDD-AB1]
MLRSPTSSRSRGEQIKAELGYFTHGSSLLDKAIASVRGRVEIDRAKSDRLQFTFWLHCRNLDLGLR